MDCFYFTHFFILAQSFWDFTHFKKDNHILFSFMVITKAVKPAENLIPHNPSIKDLQAASRKCQACPLWAHATQTVFGEGATQAKIMFIGEQPGYQEDIVGKPFVGPAGKILDEAFEKAGIQRDEVYVTNAVKHFKWSLKGKRHMHEKPNALEIRACQPWLLAEIEVVRPKIIVCLGSTAAQAVIRKNIKVTQERGHFIETPFSLRTMATVHPSSILRSPDKETRHLEMKKFIQDLRKIPKLLSKISE
jgi:uracil-DNA glycosylase family protein